MGMKYLKLYENFTLENKDEIESLLNLIRSGDETNIELAKSIYDNNPGYKDDRFGEYLEIIDVCKEYDIEKFNIGLDGLVNVNGDVSLINRGLTELPIKFGKVTGDFECDYNNLTTLKGCPNYVGGSFYCGRNDLDTLEGCPKYIRSHFDCYHNGLCTLEGCNIEEIGGSFNCSQNSLTSLIGYPTKVGGGFYCEMNSLMTLQWCPKEVGSEGFDCSYNPVYEIYKLFPDHKSFIDSLDYNYFSGFGINKKRLTQALSKIGVECPNKINGYTWE